MKESGTELRQLKALRHRAEALLHEKPQALSDIPPEDMQQLIHELQVHQIELEMQNEELRRTQSKLAEARDKYFDLYEFAPVGYFTLDKNALVAEANLTGANLLVVDRRSLINSSFTRFIAPDFQDNFYFHRRQVVETATKQTCELKLLKNDGIEFYGLMESIAVPDAEGNFKQFRTAITDITQRKRAEDALRENKSTIQALIDATPESALLIDTKSNVLAITEHIRAEEALRESEERYRQLVDCARDIIYTVSSDTTILSMNPAIENMTGWSPSECTDKHLASFVHPDDFPLAMEMGKRALQGDKPPIHEVRILSKSGKYVLGEFSIAPFTQRGSVVGILGVGRDITIRKKLEKALKNQAHKLLQRVKELNCLFGISELLVKLGQSLDQILQGIVDLIPLGWQYPEITCAKLDLHEKIYATKNFKETIWKHACDIHVHGDLSGTLKVCYLEEKPSRDDEPFLKEEKKLLKSIAERVGKIVEGKQAHEALWESERRFHELFSNMSNGVAVYKAVNDGEDFIFVDFNKAGERIDNFKRETLIGKSLLEIYPGAMEFGLFDVLQRVWSTGNSEQTPVIVYKDGRFSSWRENYAYKLPSGEIVAVYDDITDRVQAQEAMRKSETRYRALSEATFEAIFISEKGVCLDANQRAAELFGYDYKELIGIFGTDVIAPESKELVEQNMLSGYEKPYEAIAQKKDGSQFHVELRGKMMRYEDKDVRITVIRDINDQKQAAEALRKSEKRYRDLFNSTPIGLYRTTPEGSILDANATMLKILGYPDRNTLLQAKSLETYVDPDDRKQFQLLLEEQGFVHDFTVRLCRHDGKSIWVSINTTIVHDSDRQITYYEGAMADISARKASEEQIHELSQQLMQAQEDERQMISHELHDTVGQDLSVAKMACDLIYNELLNKRPPEAHRIKEICEALQKTILDVRNMAYDLRPPVLEELGLVEAIYRFCEDFTQMWGIPVDFQSAGLKNLKLDYAIQINLYRLVQEGLTNIRKHAAAGRVTLKLAAAFPNIILRVEDNGRGFDVKARAAAAGQEKRMGLRSMQERATLLNGKMNLQSKPGRGTKVIIKLPFEEKKSGGKENHLNR